MLKTVEKVLLLQDLEEFRLASTEHLAKLAVAAREQRVPADEYLFLAGDPSRELYLLVQGTVRLEGGDSVPGTAQRCSLDLSSVVSESPHAITARTAEPCVLLVLAYDDLVDLFQSEAEFGWAIIRYLAGRLREASEPGRSVLPTMGFDLG